MAELAFQDALDNNVAIRTKSYTAILGLNPSKGARSPLLWNAAFKAAGIDAFMHPMDVRPENLATVVAALKADTRYLGGAVAVPHKQAIGGLLDRIEPEAEKIGAVNAIYRAGGQLVGANTDGAGALSQIEDLVGGAEALKAKHLTLIGLGGAGIAVAAFLADRTAGLRIANRTYSVAVEAARRLGADPVKMPLTHDVLAMTDVLVNCTTVGYQDGPEGSPVPVEALAHLPEGATVYDIIYQPRETPLLKAAASHGFATRDGLGMNLDQAVIAWLKANPDTLMLEAVRVAMAAV